ncbi:MAG: hypothetical protein HOB98_01880, partial [Gammaproteobacteria bacterium]|nr:hypothetical protein [Gammaproteobacteria bacterium]
AGQRIIERLGYSVSPFQSSVEALAAFKENPVKFDLVVTDYTMPELTGEKLAVDVREGTISEPNLIEVHMYSPGVGDEEHADDKVFIVVCQVLR